MDRDSRDQFALRLGVLVVVGALGGCGRIGFGLGEPAPNDSTPRDDTVASVCAGAGLVAHWKMDETNGATIVDATGTNDGVWTDSNDNTVAAEAAPGQSAGALRFTTGASIYVPGFVIPTEGTFSAWLTSTFDDSAAFGGAHPMVIDAPTPRTTVSYDSDLGVYGLRTNDVSWRVSYAPPSDFTGWFHLTAVWSASGAQVYIDGALASSSGVSDARATSPAGLFIANREQLDRAWFGLIDDVRFYDYAMTAGDVTELYGCP